MKSMHRPASEAALTKVPEVTLTFWIIKIAATTLGETGGVSRDGEHGFHCIVSMDFAGS